MTQTRLASSGRKLGSAAKANTAETGPAANEIIAPGGSALLATPAAAFSERIKAGDEFNVQANVSGLVIAIGGSALVELLESLDGGVPVVILARTVVAKTDVLDAASSVPFAIKRTQAAAGVTVDYSLRVSAIVAQVTVPQDACTLSATHY